MLRSITLETSVVFARLSGDYNPLHLDPLKSRRLRFGGTVIHGVHLVLAALDDMLSDGAPPRALSQLKVDFASPILTGEPFVITRAATDSEAIRLDVSGARSSAVTIVATMRAAAPNTGQVDGSTFSRDVPKSLSFKKAAKAHGTVPLSADTALLAQLFPNAARCLPALQLAAILAATRIVGMECPGEHSIFTGLELDFEEGRTKAADTALVFTVERADERFGRIEIGLRGAELRGRLKTLYRNPPIVQPSFEKVRGRIVPGSLVGQRALVLGGSRGLGEVTAKVIAAGGGSVVISYQSGAEEAKAVAEDILAGGGSCATVNYDVGAPMNDLRAGLAADWNPTHVYYFCTPFIRFHRGVWDDDLFRLFCRYYVDGFAACVETISRQFPAPSVPRVFVYPSTAFLTKPPADGLEYVAAKAAGESLRRGLERKLPATVIKVARLPRLRTDQTGAVKELGLRSPLGAMERLVRDTSSSPSTFRQHKS